MIENMEDLMLFLILFLNGLLKMLFFVVFFSVPFIITVDFIIANPGLYISLVLITSINLSIIDAIQQMKIKNRSGIHD